MSRSLKLYRPAWMTPSSLDANSPMRSRAVSVRERSAAEEAAREFGRVILLQADQIVTQSHSREVAGAWLEAAAFAYGARLEERRAFHNSNRAYER